MDAMTDAMIKVQLVPMAEEDKAVLRQAEAYLINLGRLLDRDDWEGWETIAGLNRLKHRIAEFAMTYEIPVPVSRRTKEPLFTGEEDLEQ